jgi:hypothetical protein
MREFTCGSSWGEQGTVTPGACSHQGSYQGVDAGAIFWKGKRKRSYRPHKLSKILNRDLKAAGIAKRDDRGRTLDVHALRHTFGMLLSKGGVAPRTAQAAMRHSKIDLTMTVYTDPKLLDVRGALDALPSLPLHGDQAEVARATGTEDDFRQNVYSVAPTVAPTWCNGTQAEALAVSLAADKPKGGKEEVVVATSQSGKRKGRLSSADNRLSVVGAIGLEPMTPSVSSSL